MHLGDNVRYKTLRTLVNTPFLVLTTRHSSTSFFFIFVASVSSSTNVQRCIANSGALPSSTTIEGCRNPPCDLPQLRDAVVHMSFVAPRNIRSMRTLATAYLGNLAVPYNLGSAANTCNFLTNTRCPVNRGATVNYTLRMFIESFFPVGTSTVVEFRVVDDNNNAVVCVRVPIRIVRARNTLNGNIEA